MAQPSASAHAHFQAPRRTRAGVPHAAVRCMVHVACCSSHACMPHIWAWSGARGPLPCSCTSCVVCCVLRAAGRALRVARYTLDGVCCAIACCMLLERCGTYCELVSRTVERSRDPGAVGCRDSSERSATRRQVSADARQHGKLIYGPSADGLLVLASSARPSCLATRPRPTLRRPGPADRCEFRLRSSRSRVSLYGP